MTTLLPIDSNHRPIPVLGLRSGGAHQLDATTAGTRTAVPFNPETRVISVIATGPVRIALGGPTVTAAANGHFLPAWHRWDLSVRTGETLATHLAVRADAEACILHVSERA